MTRGSARPAQFGIDSPIWKVLIVSAIALAILVLLVFPESDARLEYFFLVVFADFAFALWICPYLPLSRVIGLAVVGLAAGLLTEGTGSFARLWAYRVVPEHFVAGILLYSLTSIALFGPVYLLNRMISRLPFGKASGWGNSLIVFLLFLALLASASREDGTLDLIRRHPCVQVYYGALFFFAAAVAFCLRLGTLLSIILAAAAVSWIGQYAGGTYAHIWTFLPDESPDLGHAPPTYVIIALWPLEYIVTYGLSALIADHRAWRYLTRKWLKGKPAEGPAPNLAESAGSPGGEEPEIPTYEDGLGSDGLIPTATRACRRSYVRMLTDSPETGELITALAGLALVASTASQELWAGMSWPQADFVASILILALLCAPRLFWKRLAAFALTGTITGYALFGAVALLVGSVPASSVHLGCLSWGIFSFLVFLVIYGLAHYITCFVACARQRKGMVEDSGEPSTAVGLAAGVLTLLYLLLLLIGPTAGIGLDGLTPDPALASARCVGTARCWLPAAQNPSWILLVCAPMLAFCVWRLFPQIPFVRGMIQLLTATVVAFAAVWLSPWTPPPLESMNGFLFCLYLVPPTVLAYLFCTMASAHLSGEPLAKRVLPKHARIFVDSRWERRSVVFHNHGVEIGPRRVFRKDNGTFHTYRPARSAINVSVAKQLAEGGGDLSIQETVQNALNGLDRGRLELWKDAVSLKDEIRGKIVFIKPNVVVPCGSPYTTSPELVAAVIEYCLGAGAAKVIVGEMAISNITSRMTLHSTGLVDYWRSIDPAKVDVLLLDEESFVDVTLSDAEENVDCQGRKAKTVLFDHFHMPAVLFDKKTYGNAFFINIPKMKTHLQSCVTLGIKNAHGLVHENDRGCCHQRICQKVVDITKAWMPDLTIIDGYDALEGIGPWPGDLVPLRAVIASDDVVLADYVASQLMSREPITPVPNGPIDFATKRVKTTWLAHEQGVGNLETNPAGEPVCKTITRSAAPVPLTDDDLRDCCYPFRAPEWPAEGLIKNIGGRFGQHPDFGQGIQDLDPDLSPWNPMREYMPLEGPNPADPDGPEIQATSSWGHAILVSDEWRTPDLGASVMFSGVFGLMKALLEAHFPRELKILDGFAIVYGPLRKPLECEGAILFGDGAISTAHLVYAPKIYRLAGNGKPPNYYSDTFERLSAELGGKLLGFTTQAITAARGEYW